MSDISRSSSSASSATDGTLSDSEQENVKLNLKIIDNHTKKSIYKTLSARPDDPYSLGHYRYLIHRNRNKPIRNMYQYVLIKNFEQRIEKETQEREIGAQHSNRKGGFWSRLFSIFNCCVEFFNNRQKKDDTDVPS